MNSEISDTVNEMIDTITGAGLRAAYFSIEPELGPAFTAWLLDRGCKVVEAEWNAPQSIYVGTQSSPSGYTVLSVTW